MDVGGNYRHCRDADVFGFVERVEENEESVKSVHRHDKAFSEEDILDESEHLAN